jgi:hypothetical protein
MPAALGARSGMMAAGKPSVVRKVCIGKSALFNIAQRSREWLSHDTQGAQSLPDIPRNVVAFSFHGLSVPRNWTCEGSR